MARAITAGGTAKSLVDQDTLSWSAGLWLAIRRAAIVLLDFGLVKVVLPWPVGFFFEMPGNPVFWRWKCGFRDFELVIRESRNWGAEELMGIAREDAGNAAQSTAQRTTTAADFRSGAVTRGGVMSTPASSDSMSKSSMLAGKKRGGESPYWKTRIIPFIAKDYVRGKTGYAMMNADWDVDFHLMTLGSRLLDTGKMEEQSLRAPIVLAWDELCGQWVSYIASDAWTVKATSQSSGIVTSTTNAGATDDQFMNTAALSPEESARLLMQEFERRLTAMGKEGLFFRWVELMQYEASLDQNLAAGQMPSKERREQAMQRVEKLFEAEGLEYKSFVGEVVKDERFERIGGTMRIGGA